MRLHLTPGRVGLWALVLAGLVAGAIRYLRGLGAVTHLSDRFPWGLWIGFDVMSGVALAAGGFTIAAVVYIFHLERYRALLRPAILTGFLGYLLVIVALLVDLGRPWNIWRVFVMWNAHSVMSEVAWCVMLYTTVLVLEFGQVVLQRLGRTTMLRLTHAAIPPLVIAGVILSTLHQSSLGSLFLIVPGKLHLLWYTPLLPLLFFVSAVAVGLAMVTVEAYLSARMFRHTLELPLLADLGRAAAVVLSVYLGLKVIDLTARGAWHAMAGFSVESVLFGAEMLLGVVIPLVLLAIPEVNRSAGGVVTAAVLVVGGVVVNRLNVAVTGMLRGSKATYVPAWTEVLITVAIVATGVLAYLWIAEHLPVFERVDERASEPAAAHAPAAMPTP